MTQYVMAHIMVGKSMPIAQILLLPLMLAPGLCHVLLVCSVHHIRAILQCADGMFIALIH